MSQEKKDRYIPSSSNPEPSAPLEPPSYADSVAISIEDGQQPPTKSGQEVMRLSISHAESIQTQFYAVPVPPQYDALSQQPAIIQEQPVGQQDLNSGVPLVSSTHVAIVTTRQESAQKREAKRIRQSDSGSGGGKSTSCCDCGGCDCRGDDCRGCECGDDDCRDCDCGCCECGSCDCGSCDCEDCDDDSGLFAIICLLVCCFVMLLRFPFVCCAKQEEPEGRCSTCSSII